ncbi:MAG: alpha/beta hydrolase-fold protein [Chloroherpetonaceae bacterium]|nr:alpha/beta hydrolase-fold protein [Chloroherpetonaceae bacterium]
MKRLPISLFLLLLCTTQALTQEISIPLQGNWKFKVGINAEALQPNFNDSLWATINVPETWDTQNGFIGFNGLALYRKTVLIPNEAKGKILYLALGRIGGTDEVYWNGRKIGFTGSVKELDYFTERIYPIPDSLIRYGESNRLAVRVFTNESGGGIYQGVGKNRDVVGIYTKTALRMATREPSQKAQTNQRELIFGIIKMMDQALQKKQLQLYFDFLSDDYFNSGTNKEEQKLFAQGLAVSLQKYRLSYRDFEVYQVSDSVWIADYDTELDLDSTSLNGFYMTGHDERFFKKEGNTIREIGNQSRFFEISIRSAYMRGLVKTLIYLPPSYQKNQSWLYPVLYLLHPQNATPEVFRDARFDIIADSLTANGKMSEMVVVMPSDNGSLFTTPKDSSRSFEYFLFEELTDFISNDYRISPKKDFHAISGISWGATAAFFSALKLKSGQEYFSSVSGVMPQPNRRFTKREIDGDSAGYWDTYNSVRLALNSKSMAIKGAKYLFVSPKTDSYTKSTDALQQALLKRGASSKFIVKPGTASFDFWVNELGTVLEFHTQNFKDATKKNASKTFPKKNQ